jgi:hypothetical protein
VLRRRAPALKLLSLALLRPIAPQRAAAPTPVAPRGATVLWETGLFNQPLKPVQARGLASSRKSLARLNFLVRVLRQRQPNGSGYTGGLVGPGGGCRPSEPISRQELARCDGQSSQLKHKAEPGYMPCNRARVRSITAPSWSGAG